MIKLEIQDRFKARAILRSAYIHIYIYTPVQTHTYICTCNGVIRLMDISLYMICCANTWISKGHMLRHVSRNAVSCHPRRMNVLTLFICLGIWLLNNPQICSLTIDLSYFERLTSDIVTLQLCLLRNTHFAFHKNTEIVSEEPMMYKWNRCKDQDTQTLGSSSYAAK